VPAPMAEMGRVRFMGGFRVRGSGFREVERQ